MAGVAVRSAGGIVQLAALVGVARTCPEPAVVAESRPVGAGLAAGTLVEGRPAAADSLVVVEGRLAAGDMPVAVVGMPAVAGRWAAARLACAEGGPHPWIMGPVSQCESCRA